MLAFFSCQTSKCWNIDFITQQVQLRATPFPNRLTKSNDDCPSQDTLGFCSDRKPLLAPFQAPCKGQGACGQILVARGNSMVTSAVCTQIHVTRWWRTSAALLQPGTTMPPATMPSCKRGVHTFHNWDCRSALPSNCMAGHKGKPIACDTEH